MSIPPGKIAHEKVQKSWDQAMAKRTGKDQFTAAQKRRLMIFWKRVIVKGKTYATTMEAAKELGLRHHEVLLRCTHSDYDDFQFAHSKREAGWQLDILHDRSARIFLNKRSIYRASVPGSYKRHSLWDVFTVSEMDEFL